MVELPERYNAGTLIDRNLDAGRGGKGAIRHAGGRAASRVQNRIATVVAASSDLELARWVQQAFNFALYPVGLAHGLRRIFP